MWNKEETLTIQMMLCVIDTSPQIDKFNIWLLIGAGATASLLVSNVESISQNTVTHAVSWMLSLLAVSALFGFLAKLNGMKAESSRTVLQSIFSVLEQHPDTDIDAALKNYQSAFPFWVRRALHKSSNRGRTDNLYAFKLALKFVIYQGWYTMLQGLFFIGFITLAAFCLK